MRRLTVSRNESDDTGEIVHATMSEIILFLLFFFLLFLGSILNVDDSNPPTATPLPNEEDQGPSEQNQRLQGENERLGQQNQELQDENESLGQQNQGLQGENERLDQQNQGLQYENERLSRQNQRLQDENEKQQALLDSFGGTFERTSCLLFEGEEYHAARLSLLDGERIKIDERNKDEPLPSESMKVRRNSFGWEKHLGETYSFSDFRRSLRTIYINSDKPENNCRFFVAVNVPKPCPRELWMEFMFEVQRFFYIDFYIDQQVEIINECK